MNFESNSPISRRGFLQTSASAAAGVAVAAQTNAQSAAADAAHEICVFNKPLQHISYEEQAKLIADMGFAGIEGTVRKGGHVEPEKVEEDLPKQIAALNANGIEMTLMTTDITEADSEIHQRVLKTASKLGVKRFRMGSIKYTYDRPIPEQLTEIKAQFQSLIEFCKPLGIRPLHQNHAGAKWFGAAIWDAYEVLKDVDPKDAGVCFDIRHATVEGGQSWPTEFHLIHDWIDVVYCKDFAWEKGNDRPKNVPLGTGQVNYPAFMKTLKQSGWTGPISLHMEYKNHRDPKLHPESVEAIRNDMKALQKLLAGA
ncbi:MAG: sugar phosphate isomerase/epimerase family protein [Verrucomicrobiota bacterium]